MRAADKKTPGFYIRAAVLIILLTAFDRLTKLLAVANLKNQPAKSLISGVLELRYLENQGAAWGMLRGQQWFFWIITAVFLVLCLLYLIRVPAKRYYLPLTVTVIFLASGAVGNFIDRVMQKYVVDFIYFSLIDFPIFNVADIYVSLSVIVLVCLILFHYKDHDFDFFTGRGGKTEPEQEQEQEKESRPEKS
ncbi:MAG: signal peptidase II [Eubacterium sp.]|nr:signal peptidase II [Eubacterium sp.]